MIDKIDIIVVLTVKFVELMFHEMLVHCMCDNVTHLSGIEQIAIRYKGKIQELNLKGRLVFYKGEVLVYFCGDDEIDLLKLQEFLKSDQNFGYISKLYSGAITEECMSDWKFYHEMHPSDPFTEQNRQAELESLKKTCSTFSVGLELFFSVSEIMLSDKLYKFQG